MLIKFTLAAGCSTSNILRIVAPSFVMVTSPISSTNIFKKKQKNKIKKLSKAASEIQMYIYNSDANWDRSRYLVESYGTKRGLDDIRNSLTSHHCIYTQRVIKYERVNLNTSKHHPRDQTGDEIIKQNEGVKKSTVLSTNILAGLPIAGDIRILSGDRHLWWMNTREE